MDGQDYFIIHQDKWQMYLRFLVRHVQFANVQPINILELQDTKCLHSKSKNPALLPRCAYHPLAPVHVSDKIIQKR